MEMGFSEAQVHAALDGVRSNDVQLATEWLFSHSDADEDALASGMASVSIGPVDG